MKYFLNGTWVNDSTIFILPVGATPLTDVEWENRQGIPYQPTLAEARARKVAETKTEAQRRIYAIVPQWRQANFTARAAELAYKRLNMGVLTPAEQAEMVAVAALWDKVKAIRTTSDFLEADIAAAADPASVDVANSPRWPV